MSKSLLICSQCTFYKPENMGKPQGKGGSGTNGLITPFFREHLRWLLLNMLSKDFLGDWVTRNVFSFGFSPWLEVLMLHVCFISSNGKTKYFICHVFSLLFFFYVMATRNVGGKTAIYNFTEIFQWTRNGLDFQIQKVSARYFRHTLSGHMSNDV